MASINIGIIIEAIDKATGPFRQAGQAVEAFQGKIEKSASASRQFAAGFAVVGAAAGALGYKMLSAAADMEQTKIAFETMLGSGKKADEFIKQLTDFAKRTPFEMRGLEDASKKLLAFGIQANDVIPDLKSLGDIAAGVGSEKLPFLINAFGQVAAKGRLMGQELLQFTEAGVPLADELAKTFGKSTAEIQDMISKGQIGFEAVRVALANLTGEGGRFNDLMSKQADSLNGMISNLSDAWDIFLRGEGAALLDWGKQFIQFATYIVQDVLPKWMVGIKALIGWFNEHRWAIMAVAGAIAGALTPAVLALISSFAAAALALAPWMITGAIIGGVIAGIVYLVKHFDEIKLKILEFAITVLETIDKVTAHIPKIGKAVQGGIAALKSELEETNQKLAKSGEQLKETADQAKSTGAPMRDLSNAAALLGTNMKSAGETAKDALKPIIDSVKDIRKEITDLFSEIGKANTDYAKSGANEEAQYRQDVVRLVADAEQDIIDLQNKRTQAIAKGNIDEVNDLNKTIASKQALLGSYRDAQLGLDNEVAEERKRLAMNDFERLTFDYQKRTLLAKKQFLEEQLLRLQKLVELTNEHNTVMGFVSAGQKSYIEAELAKQKSFRETLAATKSGLSTWISESTAMYANFASSVNSILGSIRAPSVGMGGFTTIGASVRSVNDAVISPKGDIITTHPDDYLIATKNPGALGGNGGQVVITGNTFYSTDDAANELARILQQKLGLQFRGATF